MRTADIIRLALTGLRQQKLRTSLTMLGVLFGSFVLTFTVSMRGGVQKTIVREYSRYASLRQIQVQQNFEAAADTKKETETEVKGNISSERSERLRSQIAKRARRGGPATAVRLTPDKLRNLEQLPRVIEVVPEFMIYGRTYLNDKAAEASIHSIRVDDDYVHKRLIAGDLPPSNDANSAAVSEYLLYRLGIVDDAEIPSVLGKTVRLEYRTGQAKSWAILSLFNVFRPDVSISEQDLLEKVAKQLPALVDKLNLTPAEKSFLQKTLQPPPKQAPEPVVTYTKTLTITGVIRGPSKDDKGPAYLHWWLDDTDVLVPYRTMADWYFQASANQKEGAGDAMVQTDDMDAVKETAESIRQLGLRTTSLVELIEREQFTYLLLFGVMTSIAGVALLVAALGIINTMLMSVLERTKEIGIMKAVGARHGQIMTIFLVEGFLIGLTGGILGLVLAWAVSIPGDAWVRSLVSQQMHVELTESIYIWPAWLLIGAPMFTCIVTTSAAVFPARRAARVNPITALRHE